jgi:antitoxin CptB
VPIDRVIRLKRLKFRAWHRGTREADLMIGGFFDARGNGWGDADIEWFEAFLEEQDVDIMAWAMQVQPVPAQWRGPLMESFQKLDYLKPAA